jgi:RNA polymerase sigma-70 factor, ECF subfamily
VKGSMARLMATAVGRGAAHPVDERLFQGRDDPFPGHWRQPPAPWPPGLTSDDAARQRLSDALAELPPSWRAVVGEHDVAGRDAAEVAAGLGLTAGQERHIRNMARAALRASLSRLAR